MPTPSLSLNTVFGVNVVISPQAPAGPAFNQALILGTSTAIPSVGANSRLRQYTSLTDIQSDGFATNTPEYQAATLYFGQNPTYLWIGRQDLTAIATVSIGGAAGSGYVVGDIVTVVQSGAQGGQVKVTAIGVNGVPTAIQLIEGSQGTGYSPANNLSTTGGTGTGLEINVLTIGETPLEALTACRAASPVWYIASFASTVQDSDHEACAAFAEGATQPTQYHISSGSTGILNNAAGNLGATLQAAKYRRTLTVYSTTQGGLAPNNAYAAAAVMGRVMALNTKSAGSYFTAKFKQLTGVIAEPLTQSQVTAIEQLNVNLYLSFQGGAFTWLEQGVMSGGTFFDETLFLDMIAADMQINVATLFTTLPGIPITEQGLTQIKGVLSQIGEQYQTIGFIAPSGIWQGPTIGNYTAGTPISNGFAIYAPPVSSLTEEQRNARQFPPITFLLCEASAGHSLTVTINVQR